jgi:hypothetical protein
MSEYEVEILTDDKPAHYLSDGSYLFQDKDVTFWRSLDLKIHKLDSFKVDKSNDCFVNYYRSGIHSDLKNCYVVSRNGKLYYGTIQRIYEYDPIKLSERILFNKCKDSNIICQPLHAIEINDILYLNTAGGSTSIDLYGNTVPIGIYYINTQRSYTKNVINILQFNEHYVLTHHYTYDFTDQNKPKALCNIKLYKFPDFELLQECTVDSPHFIHSIQQVQHSAKDMLNDEKMVKKRIKMNEEYIKGCCKIINETTVQMVGKTIKITKREPKKMCIVCKSKPKPIGLILPCKHKQFCYSCVEAVNTCPECNGTVSDIIKI